MKKRTALLVCGLLLAASIAAGAQGAPTLGTGDTLYVDLSAPTTGWLAVNQTGLIACGQKSLDFLVAMGAADSFVSFHKARAAVSIGLAQ